MSRPVASVELSRVEVDHLLTILRDAMQDGSYYGNRALYYRRSGRIFDKLESAYCKLTGDDGYPLRPRADTAYDIQRRRERA